MSELKPCPFCGSKDVEIRWHAPLFGEMAMLNYVICNDCGAMGSHKILESEAIKAWNRRTDNG